MSFIVFSYFIFTIQTQKKHTVKFHVWITQFSKNIPFMFSSINHVFKCLHFNHKQQTSSPHCSLPPRDFFYFNIKYCKPLIQKEKFRKKTSQSNIFSELLSGMAQHLEVSFGIVILENFSARLGVCEYFRIKADNTQFRNILAHICHCMAFSVDISFS